MIVLYKSCVLLLFAYRLVSRMVYGNRLQVRALTRLGGEEAAGPWSVQQIDSALSLCRVTLSDEEAKRRRGQKTVIERMAPPTFDVAVEIIDRHCWRIHSDVAQAVDTLLRGALPSL